VSELQVVANRRPEVPPEVLQLVVDDLASLEFARFAVNLLSAREIWRKYQALVESPEFPEFLRPHFVAETGCEPDEGLCDSTVDVLECIELNALSPSSREALLADARTFVQEQIDKGNLPDLVNRARDRSAQ
jgi:hypothetical protein